MRKPRRRYTRSLTRFESLEGRRMMATDLAQIAGVVQNDLENDGTPDIVAVGQPVELFLDNGSSVGTFDASDTSLGTTTTDGSGAYSFDNLEAGNYFVRINAASGTHTRAGENVSDLITFSPAEAMGSQNITIDEFNNALTVNATIGVPGTGTVDAATIQGGELDLLAAVTAGAGSVEAESGFNNGSANVLKLRSDSGVFGRLVATYDGDDNDANTLSQTLGLDIAMGGDNSAFALNIATDQVEGRLLLRAYSGAGNVSTATIALDNLDGGANDGVNDDVDTDGTIDGDPEENVLIDFSSFVITSGTGVDFSNVSALQLELDFTGLDENGLDAEIEVLGVMGFTTKTADFTVLNEMSLGDQIWIDLNNDGVFDAGEPVVPGVNLTLFEDANGDDSIAGENVVGTTTSDSNGEYFFSGLLPGDYLVRVDAGNFTGAGALAGLSTSTGNDVGGVAPDPDTADDDDRDKGTEQGDGSVLAGAITLIGNSEPTNDGDADNNSNLTVDFGFFGYDLSIDKSVDLTTAAPGDTLTYTIVVTNEGPTTATGVTFTDTLPDNVTFVSGTTSVTGESVTGSAASDTVTTTIGDLLEDQFATITITALVGDAATGVLTNSATTSGVDENDVLPNTDTAQTTIEPRIDVAITKVDDDNDQVLAPGDTITYTLDVVNNGPSTATDVTVTDTLPSGLTFVAAGSTAPTTTGGVAGGMELTYDLGTLLNDGVAQITIVAQIDEGFSGTLTNNASVTANETESIPVANNSDTAESTVAIPRGSLNGKVYIDIDGDNVQDPEDQPIQGVLIMLFDSTDTMVATTTTDATGSYEFTNLLPGIYRVVQAQPTAFPDLDETSGTPGADVSGDNEISNIAVAGNEVSPANDFTEGLPTIGKRSFFWSRLFGGNGDNDT